MRIGRYEWYVLWATLNRGGRISIDELKTSFSGFSSATIKTMRAPLYKRVEAENKALLRASRGLQGKGLVHIEETKDTPYSVNPKVRTVFLTNKGLITAQRYAMPRPDAKPDEPPYIPIVTDATPKTIFTYDEHGRAEAEHEVTPITREQYLKIHAPQA